MRLIVKDYLLQLREKDELDLLLNKQQIFMRKQLNIVVVGHQDIQIWEDQIQEKAEGTMQGRVFGLMGAMYSGFLPVGMAIFGPLADILPLQWIMVGSGIALILVTVYLQVKSKLDLQMINSNLTNR